MFGHDNTWIFLEVSFLLAFCIVFAKRVRKLKRRWEKLVFIQNYFLWDNETFFLPDNEIISCRILLPIFFCKLVCSLSALPLLRWGGGKAKERMRKVGFHPKLFLAGQRNYFLRDNDVILLPTFLPQNLSRLSLTRRPRRKPDDDKCWWRRKQLI